jgi:phage I-like protein
MNRYGSVAELPIQVTRVLPSSLHSKFFDLYKSLGEDELAYTMAWRQLLTELMGGDALTIDPPVEKSSGEPLQFAVPIALSEGSNSTWHQALSVGTYFHPRYGEITITEHRVTRFSANVNNKVRGAELDVDYEHKRGPEGGRAAGWIKMAEDRGSNGLWVFTEFTQRAADAIRAGEYRYFSSEFDDEWEDPATRQKFQDVLFGGGITNRPFLRNMPPINLSEFIPRNGKEVRRMTLQELLEKLGVPESKALVEIEALLQARTKLQEVTTALGEMTTAKEKLETDLKAANTKLEEVRDPKAEKEKKFAEDYPEEFKQLQETRRQLREDRVNAQIAGWLKDAGVHRGLPAKFEDPVKSFILDLPEDKAKVFSDIVTDIVRTGLVDFKEIGSGGPHENGSADASSKLDEAVAKLQADNPGMSYREASAKAVRDNPQLAKDWKESVKPGGDGGR